MRAHPTESPTHRREGRPSRQATRRGAGWLGNRFSLELKGSGQPGYVRKENHHSTTFPSERITQNAPRAQSACPHNPRSSHCTWFPRRSWDSGHVERGWKRTSGHAALLPAPAHGRPAPVHWLKARPEADAVQVTTHRSWDVSLMTRGGFLSWTPGMGSCSRQSWSRSSEVWDAGQGQGQGGTQRGTEGSQPSSLAARVCWPHSTGS